MAVTSLAVTKRNPVHAEAVALAAVPAREGRVTYRTAVVGESVADVVRSAGGWLADRALAGWQVTVLVAGDPDDRPLRILGAEGIDLESGWAAEVQLRRPDTLAVAAELYRRDARVRRFVRATGDRGDTEVAMWGQTLSTDIRGMCTTQHHLGVAARAFKRHALAAIGLSFDEVGDREVFRSGDLQACPLGARDLLPIA
jgi:hypothetical protein